MNISLNNFEQDINSTILQRGLKYFKQGAVGNVDEISDGVYEAEVEGSEDYIVTVTTKNNVITDCSCTCPFGTVCKHAVAAFYQIRKDKMENNTNSAATSSKMLKPKSVEEQVEAVLGHLSLEDLKESIRSSCKSDKVFRELFLANHANLLYPESQSLYTKKVKTILNALSDRHNFIAYSQTHKVASAVSEIISQGEKAMEKRNFQTAFYIASAVLVEMVEALEFADDSNGEIGGCIEESMELLNSLTKSHLSESLRKEFFNYAITVYKNKNLKGWDWHFDMLSLAMALMKEQSEKALLWSIIDAIQPNGKAFDWDLKNGLRLKLAFVRKTENEEAAVKFMESNLYESDFREKLIDISIQNKDYKKAMELAEEGVLLDEKSSPGLANSWRERLLQIYQNQNDIPNALKMLRYLFFNGMHMNTIKNYELMQQYVTTENWSNFVKALLEDAAKIARGDSYYRVSQILIWEKSWELYFALLQKNPTLDRVLNSEKYLANGYAPQLVEMYQTLVLKYLENNMSRAHYQNACGYIQRMLKLGGAAVVAKLIEQLRSLYPQRKALMDELNQVSGRK